MDFMIYISGFIRLLGHRTRGWDKPPMRICTHHEVYVADIDEARPSRLDDTDVVSVEHEPAGFDVWFIGDHESSLAADFRGVDSQGRITQYSLCKGA